MYQVPETNAEHQMVLFGDVYFSGPIAQANSFCQIYSLSVALVLNVSSIP